MPIVIFAAADAAVKLDNNVLIPVGVAISIIVAAFFVGRKLQQFIDEQKNTNLRIGSLETKVLETQTWVTSLPCRNSSSVFQAAIQKACESLEKESDH